MDSGGSNSVDVFRWFGLIDTLSSSTFLYPLFKTYEQKTSFVHVLDAEAFIFLLCSMTLPKVRN